MERGDLTNYVIALRAVGSDEAISSLTCDRSLRRHKQHGSSR
jgi:hypothetical protein